MDILDFQQLVARLLAGVHSGMPSELAIPTSGHLLIRRHHLAPLLYSLGYGEFKRDFVQSALRAERDQKVLREIEEDFKHRGLGLILLKGAAYAHRLYDDPAQRPMNDMDLMVEEEIHSSAVMALTELGFTQDETIAEESPFHHSTTLRRDDVAIDLHKTIVQPLRSEIDLRSVWTYAIPSHPWKYAKRPRPVDEAVFHFAHIGRHELMVPLISYVDASRLLRSGEFELQEVTERAKEFRLGRLVSAAVAMSNALAGATIERSLLPGVEEVLRGDQVNRWRQVLRKCTLVEGPKELAGLVRIGLSAKRFWR